MPPTTRSISSLPATPSAQSFASTSTTPRTTPRRAPRCTKCGEPRAGHPRSGCPNSPKQEPDLTSALSVLHIETPASDADNKAALRARRTTLPVAQEASLASLSSTSSEVLNRLSKPGIMSGDTGVEDEDVVGQWRETLATPTKPPGSSRLRNYMPCTLDTPGPSIVGSREATIILPEDPKPSSQNTSSSQTSALSRSLSTDERTAFLSHLATLSPFATVFRFHKDDIYGLEQGAMKLGFHTRVVMDSDGKCGKLILGRHAAAVDGAAHEEPGTDVRVAVSGGGGGQGKAFAGGAVVGAVATFTGLAFS